MKMKCRPSILLFWVLESVFCLCVCMCVCVCVCVCVCERERERVRVSEQDAVCTRSVSLRFHQMANQTIRLRHGGVVSVDGMDVQTPLINGRDYRHTHTHTHTHTQIHTNTHTHTHTHNGEQYHSDLNQAGQTDKPI